MEKLTLITFRKLYNMLTVDDREKFIESLGIVDRVRTHRDEIIAMGDVQHLLCRCGRELTGHDILSKFGWKVDGKVGENGDYEYDEYTESYEYTLPWKSSEYKYGASIGLDWTPNTFRAWCPDCDPSLSN